MDEPRRNRAAVMTAVQKIEIRDIEMPVCGDNDVVLKTAFVGICGSDGHFFETGSVGTNVVHPPFILGHEYSGTIIEVGKNVRNFAVGDRAALEPGMACGECEYCKSGRYNMCPGMQFKSCPPVDGFFRSYVSHPASLAFKLPEKVSLVDGALIEPLSVGFYSADQGEVSLGKTVAILGSGCIGLTTLLSCRQHQASAIIVTDVFDSRLEKAKAMGADYVINAAREDVVERIKEITGGRGADVVFETAGSKHTANQASHIVARCGRIVMVGVILGDIPFNFRPVHQKEADIKTVWRYCNSFPKAIKAIEEGYINLEGIVTNIYDFTDAQKAFENSLSDKEHVIKAVLKFE